MTSVCRSVCLHALIILSMPVLFGACKKHISSEPDEPLIITPLVRPQGTSAGARITKVIGPAGGTINAADESIHISVPEGAVSENVTIGIEPLSNTNIAGIGKAFRLTPHGKLFDKPVTITYSWNQHADSIGLPETLGLAYQMDDGIWKFVGADNFDKTAKTISFKTMHFSDWSLMNRISLSPYKADLETGARQDIRAMIFTEADWDDLFVPLVNDPNGPYNEPGYPVGTPAPLPSKFIRSWKLTGPGTLTETSKQTVAYKAPASIDGTASATVALELKAPRAGTYLLLSHVTILGDGWIELSINGSTPVRFPASPVVKTGSRYILSNPEDEGGGHFLLTWKGELGAHNFDLAADGTRFHFLTAPGRGYNSMFIPAPDSPVSPSGGSVNVTRLSDGRAEGTFNITNVGVDQMLRPLATAQGRFSAKLFIP